MEITKKSWADALKAIDNIEASLSVDEVFNATKKYTKDIGATSLLIGRIANPVLTGKKISAFGRSDWPREWANEWVANDYVLHDPISQYAVKSRATFDWETAREHGSKFGQKILDHGNDFNLKQGVAIPVTVGALPMGLVSISYDEVLPSTLLSRLELVSIHAYTRMLDFLDGNEKIPLLHLTKREIDILTFTAAGKTSWEISIIYGIAESTVKKHLQNIILKTNSANKTHAVTKALNEGLIIP